MKLHDIKFIFEGFLNLFITKLGFKNKNSRLYQERLNICLNCKYLDDEDNTCLICGCYVHAKTKVDYELDENGKSCEGCPKKYW